LPWDLGSDHRDGYLRVIQPFFDDSDDPLFERYFGFTVSLAPYSDASATVIHKGAFPTGTPGLDRDDLIERIIPLPEPLKPVSTVTIEEVRGDETDVGEE
jgi:hypothetical protein